MDVRDCIAALLNRHDCVIIPGFGGFIGNYSSARIDPVHHTFQPPAKKLLFNINLKQNDGLLANEVASSFSTSYAEACTLIDKFTDECRSVLKTGKPFFLPEIGQLFTGREDIIYFEQDENANLLPDAFGLTSFVSPPVIRYTKAAGTDWSFSSQAVKQSNRRMLIPGALKWAAAIVLPVGLAAVIGLTQYQKLSDNLTSNAGILESVFSRFSSASLIEKKEAPVTATVRKLPEATKKPAIIADQATPSAVINDEYYAVIVGAFRVEENAEKLIAQLLQKGMEAYIFDQSKTGLYRVTIGASSNRAEAMQLLASARTSDFSGAWILAK